MNPAQEILIGTILGLMPVVIPLMFLGIRRLLRPFARYKVKQMLAHTIPGFPSPVATRSKSRYCFTFYGAKFAVKTLTYETSDGRGFYYGEIENLGIKSEA